MVRSGLCFWVCIAHAFLLVQGQDEEPSAGPAAEFYLYDLHSLPCILMRINVTIAIERQRTANKKYLVDIPRTADVKGKCGSGSDSEMILKWGTFQLNWHFQKSHVSDAWYVDRIILSYNTAEKVFNDPEGVGEVQEIQSPSSFTQWLTPIGQAYSCGITQDIKLLDIKKNRRVTLTLRQIRIQPFASMTRRQYGDAFVCPEEAGRRDETVPIAVGSTLALVVLITIGAYAGYRYFKVKKIEYDTME